MLLLLPSGAVDERPEEGWERGAVLAPCSQTPVGTTKVQENQGHISARGPGVGLGGESTHRQFLTHSLPCEPLPPP